MENNIINVSLDIQVSEEDDISIFEDFDSIIRGKVYDALSKYSCIPKSISEGNIEIVSVKVDMLNYRLKAYLSIKDEEDYEIIRASLSWNINY